MTASINKQCQIGCWQDLLDLTEKSSKPIIPFVAECINDIIKLTDSADKIIALAEKSSNAADAVVCYGKNDVVELFNNADKVIALAEKSSDTACSVVNHGKECVTKLFDSTSLNRLAVHSLKSAQSVILHDLDSFSLSNVEYKSIVDRASLEYEKKVKSMMERRQRK
ncbi:MAG: hypothetical protein LLF94_06550 [Chlamydiales bacterium]|nr:hypothetical protein [Chlamydiales bacterium]